MDVAETTPQTMPKVAPILETQPMKSIVEEEIIVSTTTYKDSVPSTTTTMVEEIKVTSEYKPVSQVETPRNEYKPLESVGAKKMNIIYPEDPADGDNVCIACQ
jgi:hypothetical protein